jgi:hypothetical protein
LSKSLAEYFGSDFESVQVVFEDFLENKIGKSSTPQGYAGQNTLTLSTKEVSKSTNSNYCYQSKQYKSGNWFVSEYEVPKDCVYDGGDGASCPMWRQNNPTLTTESKLKLINYSVVIPFFKIVFLFIVSLATGILLILRKRKMKSNKF